ncbi:MAG TPA: XRE family transcriptional regulator [Aquifex aeolicus]|uniref:XRE family transcriptional regulator n=1 Tax=Aquifex aeolicus TaxID=63363 RepID=A0A7C5QDN9_AQUAO|nr:XRE family transcriptional regulator [Aquifex aeolicus]
MSVKDRIRKLRRQPGYIYEGLKYDLSEQLYDLMKEKGLTKKELAERMGVSPAYVSKIFGAENISLRTIAKVLAALDAEDVTLKITPRNSSADKLSKLFSSVQVAWAPVDLTIEETGNEGEEIGNAA